MSVSLQADSTLPQGYILVDGQRALTVTNNGISVTATGTLSARSLADRFADVINVKDFGAKGDSVTDDTAAIQAAINNLGSRTLYFPAGNYFINTQYSSGYESRAIGNYNLRIQNLSGFKVLGDGIGATKLILGSTGNYSHILFIWNCSDFTVKGLEFVGNNTGLPSTHNNGGLLLYNVNRFVVEDIKTSIFQGSHFVGSWWFNGTFKNIFQIVPNLTLSGSVPAGAWDFASVQNIYIKNNIVYGVPPVSGAVGFKHIYDPPNLNPAFNTTGEILLNNISNNIRVTDSYYTGLNIGAYLQNANNIWFDNCNFHNNFFEGTKNYTAGLGIDINPLTPTASCLNVNVVNSTFNRNGALSGVAGFNGGIFINSGLSSGKVEVNIQNCRFYDNKDTAVGHFGLNTYIESSNNVFANLSGSNQVTSFAGNPFIVSTKIANLSLTNIPSSSTGLTSGSLYRDAQNYIRIVP